MEITWYGHACFRLSERGIVIVTDPFPEGAFQPGYARPRIRADLVTISHNHPGHNQRVGFRGSPRFFDGPGEYEVKGVFATGVAAFHDGHHGATRGRNTIFLFEFGDLTVCHLGDLGHVPHQDQVEALSDVDVLLVPVGGMHTLDASQAAEVVGLIEPKLVIPMHYQTPAESAPLHSVDRFLQQMGLVAAPTQAQLRASRSSLPEETQVILLDYRH